MDGGGVQEERAYRNALGAFATGVAVVTTGNGAAGCGAITVNSLTSVSLEPRFILWCLGDQSDRYVQFAEAERFGLTILGADQGEVAVRYSKQGRQDAPAAEIEMLGGAPVLTHGLARFGCRTHERRVLGDHLVIVGEVTGFDCREGDGLTYFRGSYGKTSP